MAFYQPKNPLIPDAGVDDSWFVRPDTPAPAVAPTLTGGASAPTAPPGSVGVPGNTPNYEALITGDPLFRQFRADLGAEGVSDAASRQRAIRSLLTQFGGVPEGSWDVYGDADEATRLAAQNNPHSVLAQIGQQGQDAEAMMRAALSARGLSSSGQRVFEEQRLGKALSQAQYNARTGAMDTINQAQGGFVSAERQRARDLASQMAEAMRRQTELHPATPGGTANLDNTMEGPNGEPVYLGADGNYYTQDGRLISGVRPKPGAPQVGPGGSGATSPFAPSASPEVAYGSAPIPSVGSERIQLAPEIASAAQVPQTIPSLADVLAGAPDPFQADPRTQQILQALIPRGGHVAY